MPSYDPSVSCIKDSNSSLVKNCVYGSPKAFNVPCNAPSSITSSSASYKNSFCAIFIILSCLAYFSDIFFNWLYSSFDKNTFCPISTNNTFPSVKVRKAVTNTTATIVRIYFLFDTIYSLPLLKIKLN